MAEIAGGVTFVCRGMWRLKLFTVLVRTLVVVMSIANSLGRRSGKSNKARLDFVVKCRKG